MVYCLIALFKNTGNLLLLHRGTLQGKKHKQNKLNLKTNQGISYSFNQLFSSTTKFSNTDNSFQEHKNLFSSVWLLLIQRIMQHYIIIYNSNITFLATYGTVVLIKHKLWT